MVGRSTQWMVALVALILLVGISPVWGQLAGSAERENDWQVTFMSGYFSSGSVMDTHTDAGERVKVSSEGGWSIGLRWGAEQEYLGWEVGFSAVFADLDLEADSFAVDLPSSEDATFLLGGVNLLWFPTGNDLGNGRVRPYVTVGPGVVHFDSDYDEAGSETMLSANAGVGVKFLLGDEGNPVLRFEWRWHYMMGVSSDMGDLYRQELVAGIGFRF